MFASPAQSTRHDLAGERCAVLIGSHRYLTTLRAASRDRFLIGGWPGLTHGTLLHLILDRGRSVVLECEVIGATTLGIELARVDLDAANGIVEREVLSPTPYG